MERPSTSLRCSPASASACLNATAARRSWLSGRPRPNVLAPIPTMAASMLTASPVRTQHDAPCGLAGLDQRMRLGRLLERQRHGDDRLDRAARDQRKAVFELLARGAGRAQHRYVLEEQLRRIERHELSAQLTDHDP